MTCQVCGKAWPEDTGICPDDGTWLADQTVLEIKPRSRRNSLGGEFGGPEVTDRQPRATTDVDSTPLPASRRTGAGPLAAAAARMAAELATAPTKPAEITAGMMIGEYEVEAKVGEGAMGTVYRAIHPAIHKRVAIKVMTPKVFDEPESVKRFVTEARAVAAIEHPGIVDVFGFGRMPDGRTYLVMEWLEGQSLGARLEQGPLPWRDALEIIRQIARALEAAHAKSIIHRDLKPENVFLRQIDDDKPVVKLLDFGLAKTEKKEDALVARTRSGQMLGTPLYMSPEQCKSKGVDHRTDIYALGCMCYELLLGRTPFDADNVAELISAHLVGTPPQPSSLKPDLAPDLDKLLFNMIAKDPDRRPPLGEIRRIISMQLSEGSNPVPLLTPPFGVPTTASPAMAANGVAPAASPAPSAPASVPATSFSPPNPGDTAPGSIAAVSRLPTSIETDEEMLAAIRSPRWPILVAIAAALAVLVALVALR